VWNSAIAGQVAQGRHREALTLYSSMAAANTKPNGITLLSLLTACSNLGDLARGKKLHALITADAEDEDHNTHNIPLTEQLATALITMYSECHALGEAIALFEKFSQRHWRSTEGGIGVWSAMIAAYVSYQLYTPALKLFASLLVGSSSPLFSLPQRNTTQHPLPPSPNEITLLSILPACAEVGDIETGKKIHHYISEKGLRITDPLSAALISMYSRSGSLDNARSLFDQMRQEGIAGINSWNAIIAAYGDHRLPQHVFELFEAMNRHNNCNHNHHNHNHNHNQNSIAPYPDKVTLNILLHTCSHTGLVNEALHIVSTMKEAHGVEPDIQHHCCVIDALGRAGRLAEAETYLLQNVDTKEGVGLPFSGRRKNVG